MSQTNVSLPSALDLRGRRALVTGAASGIGRASALALAQLGAELLLTDRGRWPARVRRSSGPARHVPSPKAI
jgi:NAD(P)-dependent dehydrogenase (short-subunit alcohol dehydrogenase family)